MNCRKATSHNQALMQGWVGVQRARHMRALRINAKQVAMKSIRVKMVKKPEMRARKPSNVPNGLQLRGHGQRHDGQKLEMRAMQCIGIASCLVAIL